MSVRFGKRIKEIRKKNNLTQLEFSQILGYKDKSMIAHIEKGETEMSNDKIALLINRFNVDANELFIMPRPRKKIEFQIAKKNELNEEEYIRLIELSKIWVEENISFGMMVNNQDDIKLPCYLALADGTIVGYAFGHIDIVDKKSCSLIEVGETIFYIDEIYVHPDYRSLGIGKALFHTIEKEISGRASFITLVTSTKNWQKALLFYEKQNGMVFHDAYLVKKL